MIIEAGGLIINIELKRNSEFLNLEEYKTDKKPEFFLNSCTELPAFNSKELIAETEYYDMYKTELGDLQVQKYGDTCVGSILYQDKTVTIYPIDDSFSIEYLLSQYGFVYWIKKYTNSLFVHGSSVVKDGAGILFLAKSGTGKSTQRKLWEKYGNAICLNDDKNILSFVDDEIYLFPNPWSGKHFIGHKISAPLKAIIFLSQNITNVIHEVSKLNGFLNLLKQVQLPSIDTESNWNKFMDTIARYTCLEYKCTMDESAYYILYTELLERGVFGEKKA